MSDGNTEDMKKQTRAKVRRGGGRRKRSSSKAMRVFLMLLVIAGVIFSMGSVITKAARPYLISYGESKEIAEVNRQTAEAAAENSALKRDIKYLTDPKTQVRALEEEARKLGWVKKGETALVVEQPKKPGEDSRPVVPTEKRSFWQDAGKRVLGIFVRPESAR